MNSDRPQSRRNRGLFIVFEGPDGSGKTTISQGINDRLKTTVGTTLATFPGKEPGTLGELVYRLHHNSKGEGVESITPSAVQALHIAAHLDAIEVRLKPALVSGQSLVLDRYWWSTWVYGTRGDMSAEVLDRLIDAEVAMWGTIQPDAIFLITRDEPIDRDMPESEWTSLSTLYRTLAERERSRSNVVIVDNSGPIKAAESAILRHLDTIGLESSNSQ